MLRLHGECIQKETEIKYMQNEIKVLKSNIDKKKFKNKRLQ